MDISGDSLLSKDTLVTRSACALCGDNFLLRGIKYAQLIETQDALNITMVENPRGAQRVCHDVVPMEETIKVCMPCWDAEQFGELRHYAHAPLAAEVLEMRIG
jgi:hypothetical protein